MISFKKNISSFFLITALSIFYSCNSNKEFIHKQVNDNNIAKEIWSRNNDNNIVFNKLKLKKI